MSEDEFEAVLDTWMIKQIPWNLRDAINLLLKRDPAKHKDEITLTHDQGDPKAVRIFHYALLAIEENDGLTDLAYWIKKKTGAADFAVNKRQFIKWAKGRWKDAVSHLSEAVDRYDKSRGKLNKNQEKAARRTDANRAVLDLLIENRKLEAVLDMSNHEIRRQMKKLPIAPEYDLYGPTRLNKLLNRWLNRS